MSGRLEHRFQQIAEALTEKGWAYSPSHGGIDFVRTEPVKGGAFEITLRFYRQYLHHPPICVAKIVSGDPKDFPWHRLSGDQLCHFDSATAEWDPEADNFIGVVLFVAQRAIEEFHRLQKGEALTEADLEFPVHWKGVSCLLDIPSSEWPPKNGTPLERVDLVTPETGQKHSIYRLANVGASNRFAQFEGARSENLVPAVYLDLAKRPSPALENFPPKTLADLGRFIHRHQPQATKAFWRNLAEVMARKDAARANALIIMNTPSGRFGALIKGGKAEIPGFRHQKLPGLLSQTNHFTRQVPISLRTFLPIDAESVLGRNQPTDRIPLAGKVIHLIGLGAVGSILADRLMQAGAGAGGGALHLFDFDALRPENLGRHLLGFPYLGMNKAEGVAHHLRRNRLAENVFAHPFGWWSVNSDSAVDLVIDATAVPKIGAALSNAIRQTRRFSMISAFVEGAGWSAGAFLYRGQPGEACRSCLAPWIGGAGANVQAAHAQDARDNGCGGVFTPFRAAAADVAAALAAEMACGWAAGEPGKTFRTVRMPSAPAHVHSSRNETPRSNPTCLCARLVPRDGSVASPS